MRAPKPGSVARWLWFSALAAGSAAIAWGSAVYFDAEELPPFVIEKLPLPAEDLYLAALQAHVVAASFALPACLLLALPFMLRFPRAHRWLGRVTSVVVLLALVPSGFYLSVFAKGGLASTLGFMLSGLIVWVGMVRAVMTAWARDFIAHRRFTLHVLGQLVVAVVSRAMLFAFDAAGFDPDPAYLVSLWAPVLGSVVIVELLTTRRTRRNRHEAPAPLRPVAHRELGLSPAV
ncbi:MAG: DUF2306 domain-containing protein [Archangiaceae bacterium]|nr:DUF2306 domain-containing protein [Archangiaceae bacterium]